MDELLANGLKTRQTNIRPAGSVSTAFQLVAVIFQLQSLQQFGGVAATHLDWTLVPYVRKSFAKHFRDGMKYIEGIDIELPSVSSIEDSSWNEHPKAKEYALAMTKREIEQGAEGMLHNLNSLQSRSGNQLPFSSINYGTCTLLEGRMVIQAILEMTLKGTGSGQTSIFPCQIFQLMDGVNTKKGDKNYDLFKLALKCTAKRMYPNYVNCDWSNDQDVMDVKAKDEILANLTEAEKEALIKAIEKDPSLGDILGLDVVEE
jgi:ribonucleoside-triphosphate reductase